VSSVVAANYLSLTEVDSTGAQLSTIPFSSISFISPTQTLTSGAVQYVTYTGTMTGNSLQVTITVAVSEYAGQLTNGATVTPKSLETMFEIQNYPFQSQSSNLVLSVAVGIANGQSTGSWTLKGGYNVITSGTGKAGAYFSAATTATISNGQKTSVTVTSKGEADSSILGAGLGAVFNAFAVTGTTNTKESYQIVNFTMAGSPDITFDPAPGYSFPGTGENAAMGSAQTSLLAICFTFLLCLLQL